MCTPGQRPSRVPPDDACASGITRSLTAPCRLSPRGEGSPVPVTACLRDGAPMNTDFIIATGDATLAGREARTALRRPEMLRARVETSVTSGMRPVADTRDDLLAGLGAARPAASGGDPHAQGFFA